MITLVTGGPGMGKTAIVVKWLLDKFPGRPIFSNIKDLKLEHFPIPKVEEWTREVLNEQGTSEFSFNFPPGSVIVIDECQHFFRPRSPGSKVPPYIQAFETHRHEGLDFILMTQGAHLVDSNLRTLIKGGKHFHLRSTWLGRYSYESSELIDVDSRASLNICAKRRYKLPQDVFHLYKSSELHTKPPKPRVPLVFYGVVLLFFVGSFLGWRIYNRFDGVRSGGVVPSVAERGPAQPGALPHAQAFSLPSGTLVEAMTPVDSGNILSASLYGSVVPVPVAPVVRACVSSASACRCYSQQGTVLPVAEWQCRERAAGQFYDPFQPPPPPEAQPYLPVASKPVSASSA